MSRSSALVYLSILFLQTHLSISVNVPVSSVNGEIDAMLDRNGVVVGEEGEEMMPSDISRRVMMMRKQYISYATLRRDMVPCQKPGASYYACRSGQANSYSRGCNIITRCARDTSDIKT
ncbi:Protein RALF-like 24 [Raphanus sativus]|uniref:Protein RALF-like 24 n=1 Tax=Raphanus sativus TaxID=3726 RepID=A0A6J0NVQ4_RAPSA|nr:protein RALF-like 24 [Raphanus sativus]KAJ4894420.1 Protein RALF-like 24 [Raphanus sativus]